jgi:hypothetical protein
MVLLKYGLLGVPMDVVINVAELRLTHHTFDYRIITGLGILLLGIGIANLVRYGVALKDVQSARRLTAEEKDEWSMLIRTRAGNKAYWVSASLIYGGLMWESFAANDKLPALTGDPLWFFLAAGVLLPFGVYITSILIDQQRI